MSRSTLSSRHRGVPDIQCSTSGIFRVGRNEWRNIWETFGLQFCNSSWQVWPSDLLERSRQSRPSIPSRMGTCGSCLVGCLVEAALNLSVASDATYVILLDHLKIREGQEAKAIAVPSWSFTVSRSLSVPRHVLNLSSKSSWCHFCRIWSGSIPASDSSAAGRLKSP